MSPTNAVSSLSKELSHKIKHLYKNLQNCYDLIEELQKENSELKAKFEIINALDHQTELIRRLEHH